MFKFLNKYDFQVALVESIGPQPEEQHGCLETKTPRKYYLTLIYLVRKQIIEVGN